MNLTPQQEALIDYCVNGDRSFMGIARAGTGKTFTAKRAAEAYHKAYPKRVIHGMAFNKIISVALAKAIPFAPMKTANSWGLSGWVKRSGKRPLMNEYKTKDIIKEIGSKDNFSDLNKAIGICKAWALYLTERQPSLSLTCQMSPRAMPSYLEAITSTWMTQLIL